MGACDGFQCVGDGALSGLYISIPGVSCGCATGFAGAQGRSTAAFPQPRSLSAALLEMQLLVLGPLTAAVSEANQLQILGVGLLAAP